MMSPEAQRKLERIEKIRVSMEALERELEDILNAPAVRPLTVRDRAVEIENKNPTKYMQKKERTCKACGKPGHRRDTCPDFGRATSSEAHALDGALMEEEYKKVKDCKSHGLRVADIAEQTGYDHSEVAKAYAAGSYGLYIKSRK